MREEGSYPLRGRDLIPPGGGVRGGILSLKGEVWEEGSYPLRGR